MSEFESDIVDRTSQWGPSSEIGMKAQEFLQVSAGAKYPYNFFWLGRPIIQYPQDIVATQELIWSVKPDLIIETGIAHGGSLILSASILAMIEYEEAFQNNETIDPRKPRRKVLGVDIDIREHNRTAIDAHAMRSRIDMIQGSSIDEDVIGQVKAIAAGYDKVMVFLDSNHTHDHVYDELRAYAPLVSSNSYCVVFDTLIEDMPEEFYPDRSWGPGNSPASAVREYMKETDDFEVDRLMDQKILISVAIGGFLKKK